MILRSGTGALAHWYNAALATDFALHLDRWMRATFAGGKASVYDRAMDKVHATFHLGPDHRLFDGSHDVANAWEKVSAALPDDTKTEEIIGLFNALWKDVVTPKGLPIVSFEKAQFDDWSAYIGEHFGITRQWMTDAATVTATEALGAAIGTLAVSLNWSKAEIKDFGTLAGGMGLSAAYGANPLLTIVALVCLARGYQRSKDKSGKVSLIKGIFKGGFGTGVMISVSSLIGGPVWIVLMVAICAGVISHKLFDKADTHLSSQNWSGTATFWTSQFRAGLSASLKQPQG